MIIRLADCPPEPWKNGRGSTRQIAVHPVDAGVDDFVWRASVAEVDSGAPFSCFPGIERQIALLEGKGFTMVLDEAQTHALTTPFAPFAFSGEAKVTVTLAGGPTRDFNLMVRRAHARGEVLAWHQPATRRRDQATALVFCARGRIETPEGCLNAGDAWVPPPACADPMTLREGALALLVRIVPQRA